MPLYSLSKKAAEFQQGLEQMTVFKEVKHPLISAPVLVYPDFSPGSGIFVLNTDANQWLGIGADLFKVQSDGCGLW